MPPIRSNVIVSDCGVISETLGISRCTIYQGISYATIDEFFESFLLKRYIGHGYGAVVDMRKE